MSSRTELFSPEERTILEARAAAAASTAARVPQVQIELEDLVVVRSGADLYGVRARSVRAVAALNRLAPLPAAPAHVAGLTAFRGNVLVVFHLHAVMGIPPTPSEYARILVLDDECALAVDAIEGIEPLADVRPAPEGLDRAASFVEGVTPSGAAVLDVEALLRSDRLLVDIAGSDVGSSESSP